MTNYLTIKKILLDSVALYRAHALYITVLIGAVIAPYTLIITNEELPDSVVIIIPIFIILLMLVEMISTILASTGYVEKQFLIIDEIKSNILRAIPYLFITLLAVLIAFLGVSILVIPGIIATIVFSIIKVDYSISGRKINESFKEVIKMLKFGSFIKVLKIYLLPIGLQFILGLLLNPLLKPLLSSATLEQDILNIYPYITVALVLIFPVAICFRTAVYFNMVKQYQLNSTNQLV
ncbi:MAG: hypothetical protein OCD02_22230 [Spirochaetaceae bacterium]